MLIFFMIVQNKSRDEIINVSMLKKNFETFCVHEITPEIRMFKIID